MTRCAKRAAARGRSASDRASLYEDITNKIIAELDAGRLPWVRPWGAAERDYEIGHPQPG